MKEEQIAMMEADSVEAGEKYFNARPTISCTSANVRLFDAGFERGFKAAMERFVNTKPMGEPMLPGKNPRPADDNRTA